MDSQSDPQAKAEAPEAVQQTIEIADVAEGDGGPYKNLWVPLVVVPAGIVFAIVAVFALFGSLSGKEKSMADNLALVVQGGKNERQQALFNLTRQAAENQEALARGAEAPWAVPVDFVRDVQAAYDGLDEDEYDKRLVLGVLLSSLEDERGVSILLELAELDALADGEGRTRIGALQNLALLTDMGVGAARAATGSAVRMAAAEDVGLRVVAAGCLGSFGTDEGRQALVGLLGDEEVQVRATAAVSLSRLDPPGEEALPLLQDMTGEALWEAAREASPGQFRRASDIQRYREMAVIALGRYGEPVREFLLGLRDAEDLKVRGAALKVLEAKGWEQ